MQKINSKRIYSIVLVAMFSAIGAITSWIALPLPFGVPITLQTFGMALIGYTLGTKSGTAATLIYLSLGALGAPVFHGFTGGVGMLLGLTGGFIFGFVFLSFFCGLARDLKPIQKSNHSAILSILFGIIGIIICHISGILQYQIISKTDIGFFKSFLVISAPFIIKDIIMIITAYFVSSRIIKLLHKA